MRTLSPDVFRYPDKPIADYKPPAESLGQWYTVEVTAINNSPQQELTHAEKIMRKSAMMRFIDVSNELHRLNITPNIKTVTKQLEQMHNATRKKKEEDS